MEPDLIPPVVPAGSERSDEVVLMEVCRNGKVLIGEDRGDAIGWEEAEIGAMILYCSPTCHYGHQVRIVWHEKGLSDQIQFIDPTHPPEVVAENHPDGGGLLLVDRDLSLSHPIVILEYLEERFPHPLLYPLEPSERAVTRTAIFRIYEEWYTVVDELLNAGEKKASRLRKQLRERLTEALPLFAARPYFLSSDFSILDCLLAPLLWRLPSLGIDLVRESKPLRLYAQRLFRRASWQASLSEEEREMKPPLEFLAAP